MPQKSSSTWEQQSSEWSGQLLFVHKKEGWHAYYTIGADALSIYTGPMISEGKSEFVGRMQIPENGTVMEALAQL